MRQEIECLCAKMDLKTCGMNWWFICSSCSVKCDTIYLADAACPQTLFSLQTYVMFSFFFPVTLKGIGTCAETCRSESNHVNMTQKNNGKQFVFCDCWDWERVWRVYPICITTGDTNKINSTQALLRQGVLCLQVTFFFFLLKCVFMALYCLVSLHVCLKGRVWANVYSLWLC